MSSLKILQVLIVMAADKSSRSWYGASWLPGLVWAISHGSSPHAELLLCSQGNVVQLMKLTVALLVGRTLELASLRFLGGYTWWSAAGRGFGLELKWVEGWLPWCTLESSRL